jgi:L-ribulose-5-phosphate 4-epimerase
MACFLPIVDRHNELTAQEIASAYEWETGNVIVERFQHIDPMEMCAVLVWNHGPFGVPVHSRRSDALEIVAEMALKTAQLNPRVQPISKDLLDKHFLRKHGSGAYYGQG